jgi:DNA helicase II / ATP-dependent DNA helicase PcrA
LEQQIQSAYQEELSKLKQVSKIIEEQLEILQKVPRYYGSDFTEQLLESAREASRQSLAIASPEPYFGRLDFEETGTEQVKPLYIGKTGVQNDVEGEPLVIDWRAPVASLFYSFTGGDDTASYESPEGLIEGLVYLKRNMVIRKAILQRVVDTYNRATDNLAITDEFLLYRLGENKDNRLRDIVSTIQAEQDQIIRSAKNTALIIQGVAGSGKTTVALHRLAYLLYQYRENIRAERMIIFAPNSMFLDYISGVLPELGVGNIQQTTFADWALQQLDHEVALKDSSDSLEHWFAVGPKRPQVNDFAPGRAKGSISFMNEIHAKLLEYEKHFVPSGNYEPWNGSSLSEQTIREWFTTEYKHYPLMKRYDRVVARMKRWLEMQLERIPSGNMRKEYKKNSSAKLRAYLKKWPIHTPFTFYKEFLGDQNTFKKKQVDLEDLAPLVYIRSYFNGIEGNDKFDHTVIDEAQDFSPFQVALLQQYTSNQSFTILGDLSQGIHAYQGILHWDEFRGLFPEDQFGYYELTRSYRSTMEIIHYANAILSHTGQSTTLAEPVFRSGEPVKLAQIKATERTSQLMRMVEQLRTRNNDTVALIARTAKECIELHSALSKAGLEATLILPKNKQYAGGTSILPVYMAKGLEFDAVILVNVNEVNYELSINDAKLLYVGCTRALHELIVIHDGAPSPLINQIPDELYRPL